MKVVAVLRGFIRAFGSDGGATEAEMERMDRMLAGDRAVDVSRAHENYEELGKEVATTLVKATRMGKSDAAVLVGTIAGAHLDYCDWLRSKGLDDTIDRRTMRVIGAEIVEDFDNPDEGLFEGIGDVLGGGDDPADVRSEAEAGGIDVGGLIGSVFGGLGG